MDYRRTYRSAAVTFVDLVSRLPGDRWDEPALGDWTLRDLIGHTAGSALRQVPDVLATPVTNVVIPTAEGYFAFARSVPPEVYAAAVAASTRDARKSGLLLTDSPATFLGELTARATQALAAATDDDVVATSAGGMRVRDWLPTRTFELVVHGLDAAAAAGRDAGFAPEAISDAAALAARIAAATGDGGTALRALTGRASLPEKFSVI
jgi:uncharacterized protein (TIGR03083 family)